MKFNSLLKSIALILLLFCSSLCFSEELPTIGAIAERLTNGTVVITRLMMVVCIAMGSGLVIMSVVTYRAHRTNPKFIPLDRPVMYFILGIVVICIPLLGSIVGQTGSVLELQKKKSQSLIVDIDAPIGQ